MKQKSDKQVFIDLAVYAEQDKRVLFDAMPAGRRHRIAMHYLRCAAEILRIDNRDVLKELRNEMKLVANWKARGE